MIDGLRAELEQHRAGQVVHEAQLTQAGLLHTRTHRLLPCSGEALFQLRKQLASADAEPQHSAGEHGTERPASAGAAADVIEPAPDPHEAHAQQLRDMLKQARARPDKMCSA